MITLFCPVFTLVCNQKAFYIKHVQWIYTHTYLHVKRNYWCHWGSDPSKVNENIEDIGTKEELKNGEENKTFDLPS